MTFKRIPWKQALTPLQRLSLKAFSCRATFQGRACKVTAQASNQQQPNATNHQPLSTCRQPAATPASSWQTTRKAPQETQNTQRKASQNRFSGHSVVKGPKESAKSARGKANAFIIHNETELRTSHGEPTNHYPANSVTNPYPNVQMPILIITDSFPIVVLPRGFPILMISKTHFHRDVFQDGLS